MTYCLQILRPDSVLVIPGDAIGNPALVPFFIRTGHDEEFDFHLLEFANTEDEILRRDFVAIGLADLRDAERQLAICRIENVLEVDEDALRRFRPEIGDVFIALDRTDGRLEHQVERTWLGEIVRAAFGAFFAGIDLVGAKSFLAFPAIDERIGECGFVAGVLQDETVHQNCGIEAFHVVALVNIGAPPGALDVVLELDAHRAVVPRALQTAVQLAALKEKPSSLAQRDNLVHRGPGHPSSFT